MFNAFNSLRALRLTVGAKAVPEAQVYTCGPNEQAFDSNIKYNLLHKAATTTKLGLFYLAAPQLAYIQNELCGANYGELTKQPNRLTALRERRARIISRSSI